MTSEYDYDLFVIGAGSSGVRASRVSAALGARVAVAEESRLGGTCVNLGCVPKKLFYYASHYADDLREALGFGWTINEARFDWPTLIDNKNAEIDRLNQVYANLLDTAGVEVLYGRAMIVDPHTVAVNGQEYTSARILIAVGGEPFVPDIPGKEFVITSNEAFYLEQLPQDMTIVGGGYIAVEFASIFNQLGVKTRLLYRRSLFLRGFDVDIREKTAEEMRKKGIHIEFDVEVDKVERRDSQYVVHRSDGGQSTTECVMFATGRRPYLANLGLENTNVSAVDGKIVVDPYFRTDEPSIFALGDAIGRKELSPVAIREAMIFAHREFSHHQRDLIDYDLVPIAVFCQPSIAGVGLTEEQAIERVGLSNVEVYRCHFRHLKHTLSGSDEKTFMKLIVNKDDQRVLGIHLLGDDVAEIIQGFAVAMQAGATKAHFENTLGVHPSAAEELVTLF